MRYVIPFWTGRNSGRRYLLAESPRGWSAGRPSPLYAAVSIQQPAPVADTFNSPSSGAVQVHHNDLPIAAGEIRTSVKSPEAYVLSAIVARLVPSSMMALAYRSLVGTGGIACTLNSAALLGSTAIVHEFTAT